VRAASAGAQCTGAGWEPGVLSSDGVGYGRGARLRLAEGVHGGRVEAGHGRAKVLVQRAAGGAGAARPHAGRDEHLAVHGAQGGAQLGDLRAHRRPRRARARARRECGAAAPPAAASWEPAGCRRHAAPQSPPRVPTL